MNTLSIFFKFPFFVRGRNFAIAKFVRGRTPGTRGILRLLVLKGVGDINEYRKENRISHVNQENLGLEFCD